MFALSKVGWSLVTPSNLLVSLALAGTALALFGPAPRRRAGHRLAASALVLAVLAGLSPAATWLLAQLEDRFPAYADDGRPVAGAIVLGGAVHPTISFARGQLTVGDSAERVIAMADLARRHPAARIVFTGGSGALLVQDAPEADAVRRFGATLGVDPARILYEGRSRTTDENATETRALVAPQPGERWLLVTSAWHMPRAVGAFRRAGFDVVPYPVDYRTGRGDDLWRPDSAIGSGLDRFDLAVREWLGLVAYRLAGRTEALFPGPEGRADQSSAGPIR